MPAVAAKAGEVVRVVAEAAVAVVAVAAAAAEEEAAEAEGVAVQPSKAAEAAAAALRSSVAAAAVTMPSFSAVAVELRWFVEDLTSAAARTCACVPASTSGIGRAATDGAIATVIAARAWACTSEEAEAGVTGTIGVTACYATVTHIPTGGIATGVGADNPRKSGGPRQGGPPFWRNVCALSFGSVTLRAPDFCAQQRRRENIVRGLHVSGAKFVAVIRPLTDATGEI
jgi:hypothetical protein